MMEVVIVGPCGSGKTTLARSLAALGIQARAVAQEHSAIPELWRHAGEPEVLIYLQATPAVISKRRADTFPDWLYQAQMERLATALAHATVVVDTSPLTAAEVRERVLRVLAEHHIYPQCGKPPGKG